MGYLFCFKVTDQIKYSINNSLITLDVRQWIVLILKSNVPLECTKCFRFTYRYTSATGKDGHFVWLAFDADQRFFDFVLNSSRLFIIYRVKYVLYGDSPLIKNKEYWFWNQISLWNVSSASRSLTVVTGRHGRF